MQFSDVIGQDAVKTQLHRMIHENRLPHALLFAGPEGCGKLPMALALAQQLLCKQRTPEGDACGQCSACRMVSNVAHPDLLFVFPVFKGKGDKDFPTSEKFMTEWREQIQSSPYFSHQEWIRRIGIENQQSLIAVPEATRIISELSRSSSQDGYRVVIIWQTERINEPTANKLLKILEEPPARTVFILTTNHSEKLLSTITSRTQRIEFQPIGTADICRALISRHGLQPDDAQRVARAASGNYIRAREQVVMDTDRAQFFDLFVLFMRLCYMRKVKDLNEWAQQISLWGREKQKAFLEYAQILVRENFVNNFHISELNYMNRQEADFSTRFSPFINERNVIGITEEISLAQRDIEQNVNARMVFFDFALKMIVLLIQ